ncbi:glycosyltransferase family 9 protein [Leptolyngbya sp. FACHB-36]|nr:glycosyltransferase family 9 protein [Leptolyngbya sp. FACHB-36]
MLERLTPSLSIENAPGQIAIQQIAIVRALPGLGDLLCAVPAFRALRLAFPAARITLIGLPWAAQLVPRFSHLIDDWLEFPGFPGIPEVPLVPSRVESFFHHAPAFDLAIQLHGSGAVMNSFVQRLNAAQRAGCFPPDRSAPSSMFLPYPEHEPEIWRMLRLIEHLGIPLQGDYLEFPLWQSDWQELAAIRDRYRLNNYVCLHPGASLPDRRWSVAKFAAVADSLASQGLQIVLTGSAAEADLTRAVAQAMHSPAIDLAGQTSLGSLAALLKRTRLLICNDTGVSHLAAALHVNSVVIFSASDPDRWAPLDRSRHYVVGGTPQTAQNLTVSPSVADVLTHADRLLRSKVAYAS